MRVPTRCLALFLGASVVLGSSLPAMPAQAFFQEADTSRTKQALVEADTLIGSGDSYNHLIGNVIVRQDSTVLRSRRAYQYIASETFFFTGDVVIVERGDTLRADTVYYDRGTKIGRAYGRVFLTDGDVQVHAPSGIYFTDEKRARFEEGLTLVDSTAEITSRTGTYWSDDKWAELEGEVRLHAERTYLEADSLTYYRETEVSIARSNVFIERMGGEEENDADSTRRTLLFSQWAYNDQPAGLSRIRGAPLLLQLQQDSTGAEVDTLIMRAMHLEAVERDSLRRLIATDAVQIWRSDLAALADSVVYERVPLPTDTLREAVSPRDTLLADASRADASLADSLQRDTLQVDPPQQASGSIAYREETRLYREPLLWFGETQISGDTVRVKGQGSDIDSLFVRRNAFIAMQDTVTGRINQVRGQHVVGYFEGDSTRIFHVGPNAETIYFQRDDEDRPDGAMQVSGDRAVFTFRGDAPKEILFPGAPQGTYYPESILPDPLQLDGFRWMPERRPTKAQLLDEERVLQRLEHDAIPDDAPPEEPRPADDEDSTDVSLSRQQ